MIGRPGCRVQRQVPSAALPPVFEVHALADFAEEADPRETPGRIELHEEGGIRRVEHPAAHAYRVHVDADPSGQVAHALKVHARIEPAEHEPPLTVLNVVHPGVGTQKVEEARGIEAAGGVDVRLSVADLRDEADVGAEAVGDVAVHDVPGVSRRGVRPAQVEGAAAVRLSRPFGREVRPVRGLRVGPEELGRDPIGIARPPEEIRSEDPVVPSPSDLPVGDEEPPEGLT